MKKMFLTVSIVLMAIALLAQEKNFIDQNYIEITGRAEREVAPDEICLNITIKEKDNNEKAALPEAVNEDTFIKE